MSLNAEPETTAVRLLNTPPPLCELLEFANTDMVTWARPTAKTAPPAWAAAVSVNELPEMFARFLAKTAPPGPPEAVAEKAENMTCTSSA